VVDGEDEEEEEEEEEEEAPAETPRGNRHSGDSLSKIRTLQPIQSPAITPPSTASIPPSQPSSAISPSSGSYASGKVKVIRQSAPDGRTNVTTLY
jgi:hypothetical protein